MPKLIWKQVHLVAGIPQSGKTEYVKQFRKDWVVISADDIKKELYNGEWQWYANHDTFTELLIRFRKALYSQAAYARRIYLDYNFINIASRQQIYKIIEQVQHSTNIRVKVTIIVMDTPLSVCLERNKRRNIPIAEKVIVRQDKKKLIIERDECPYLKGRFFIYHEKYPDMPDWFNHRIHNHFNGCCKAIDGCIEGGDDDAVLLVRSDFSESSICNIPSNNPDNPNHSLIILAALLDSQRESQETKCIKWIREKASGYTWRGLVGIALQLGKNLGGKGGG